MKTLLIFDWFGQADLGMYVLEDAPDWLPKCHMKFINAGDNSEEDDDLLTRVSDAICENPDHYCDKDDELAGAWSGCKMSVDETFEIKGDHRVIITGFAP